MFKLKKGFLFLISLPKTIYFNFKTLPVKKAIKLPFYIHYDFKLGELHKNKIKIEVPLKKFMIKIGTRNNDGIPETSKGFFSISKNALIVFKDNVEISCGTTVRAIGEGKIFFGKNFYCNKNCTFVSRKLIEIGDDVLVGWNVNVRDSDGESHYIEVNNCIKENKKEITIGYHTWICANVSILKGVHIPDNCVIAYNSCVLKSFEDKNSLIAGYPAKIVTKNIKWSK